MIKPICKDTALLSQKAASVTNSKADRQTAQDLADTLRAHTAGCVGMAANMIGEPKSIIAVSDGGSILVMCNPRIAAKSEPYDTEEGCLSLTGKRKTVRYHVITVQWQDMQMKKQRRRFEGFTAQIIQHEMDHLEGILI